MKKSIWIVGIIMVLIIGYVAVGPFLTISAIKTSITNNDSEKLSENIDFQALRQNMKDQLNIIVLKNATAETKNNPFAALMAGFATKMVDGMVDSFVTPSGLASLMEGKKPNKSQTGDTSSPPKKDKLFKNASFSYDSISEFSIHVPDDNGEEARFILKRNGLSWKLVNIIIPKDLGENK